MNRRSSWLNRLAIMPIPLLALAMRYGLALLTVAAAFGLRAVLIAWIGAELPAYILFYPTVMAVALLAGLGPGILATVAAGFVAAYWILPPIGEFAIASPADRLGLAIFAGMGVFMSVVAELYRRNRSKAAAYDRDLALREVRQEKEFLADMLEHASQPFAVGYPFVDVDGSRLILEMDIDVTEQRRAAEELNQYRHRLEELVEQRTNQLTAATAEAQQLAAEAIQSAQTIRHLSLFPEQNPNPVLRIGRDGTILYANPVSGPLLAHWGLAAGQSLPEDWARQLAAIADGGQPVEQEVECAGRVFACLVTPIAGEEYVNIYGREITERKRREAQLAKLTRLYLVLSQVNEAIVRADDAQTLYADVCRIVAEKGDFPLVWIGQLQDRRVVPAASAGLRTDYLNDVNVEIDGESGADRRELASAKTARW